MLLHLTSLFKTFYRLIRNFFSIFLRDFTILIGNNAQSLNTRGSFPGIFEIISNTEFLWKPHKGSGSHRWSTKVWELRKTPGSEPTPVLSAHLLPVSMLTSLFPGFSWLTPFCRLLISPRNTSITPCTFSNPLPLFFYLKPWSQDLTGRAQVPFADLSRQI